MPNFMIAYHGGNKPRSKEEGMAQMEKWKTWVAGLGDKVVNAGTPLMNSKLVTSSDVLDDQDSNAMNGFAVIIANDIDAAIEIAKGDPFLQMEGIIRVSQMVEMN